MKANKKQLFSLDLTHNNIHQVGLSAIEKVVCEEEEENEEEKREGERATRGGLVKLRIEQMGVPLNEMSLERVRRKVKLNYKKVGEGERERLEECLYPSHLREIASVYRVNGRYKENEE